MVKGQRWISNEEKKKKKKKRKKRKKRGKERDEKEREGKLKIMKKNNKRIIVKD